MIPNVWYNTRAGHAIFQLGETQYGSNGNAESRSPAELVARLKYIVSKTGPDPLTVDERGSVNEIVDHMKKAGASVDYIDESGHSALIIAAVMGGASAVELLLHHGADKSLKDNKGKTALDHANAREKSDIIALLQ